MKGDHEARQELHIYPINSRIRSSRFRSVIECSGAAVLRGRVVANHSPHPFYLFLEGGLQFKRDGLVVRTFFICVR